MSSIGTRDITESKPQSALRFLAHLAMLRSCLARLRLVEMALKRRLALALVTASVVSGCGTPAIRRTTDEAWFRREQRSALNSRSVSERSLRLLRSVGLVEIYRADDERAIDELATELRRSPDRVIVSALAEMFYARGRSRATDSLRYFTAAMVLSYAYLFDEQMSTPPDPYDPAFRRACDIYNRSLARIVRHLKNERANWSRALELPCVLGALKIQPQPAKLGWETDTTTRFEIAYDYEVPAVENHYRSPGIGLPVIAIREPPSGNSPKPQDEFRPRDTIQAVPVTLLVRLNGSLQTVLRGDGMSAWAELYDPTVTTSVQIGSHRVPLETDTTTPLVYMLAHAPRVRPIEGVLNPAAWEEYPGLFMLQPYRRGKIPIVLVHGLLSTPGAWTHLANEIMGAPELRSRFQVWYFQYPPGNPVVYSAHLLRQSLIRARWAVDPDGTDSALDRMVLIGRSLGGLLAKLQVQDSTDQLWRSVSKSPIEQLECDADQKALLTSIFRFEALPFVARVVFIVTPHRGAGMADSWFAKFFSATVRLPAELEQLVSRIDDELLAGGAHVSSISGLSATSPILLTLADLPIAPHVTYHSIIGNKDAADTPGGTDGIVRYDSSHLAGAASEVIIRATHMSARSNRSGIRDVLRMSKMPRQVRRLTIPLATTAV